MINGNSRGAQPPASGLRGTLGRLGPGYQPPMVANPALKPWLKPEGA